MSESYIVKPVAKALEVLDFVMQEGRELTLTEIAYHVGHPKTTVFRYLQTLKASGFVAYDPMSDRYRTGVRLWTLNHSGGHHVLCEAAFAVMRDLRDSFNETVNLGVMEGKEVVYLEMVESRRSLRMEAKIGSRDRVYTTALGKAFLCSLPEERWQDHLPEVLERREGLQVMTYQHFEKELRISKARGYAVDESENEEGAYCVASPVFHLQGQVVAAISVSAPDSRMSASLQRQIAEGVVAAAAEISARLSVRTQN